jgi:dihydroflavonol-4-reductase
MNVLITGANGLLGANIVRELISRGSDVHALLRPGSDRTGLNGLTYKEVPGDILDTECLDRAVSGCDVVIHAAADTRQWPTGFSHYEAVNITGTKNVVNACRTHGVKRIIYVSTANAFGNGTKEDPGTELSEFSAFRYNSGYMISKYIAQQWVLAEVERHHLPLVVVNPTFMLGPYDAKPSSGKIILMGLGKKVHVCPPGGKNFIHVGDAATAVCNAITMGVPGECYLLAHENLSYREFFEKLDRVTGQKSVSVTLPAPVIRAAGLAGSFVAGVTGRGSALNNVNARLLLMDNYYSGRKAVEALAMPQTPVETAIADALSWFNRH